VYNLENKNTANEDLTRRRFSSGVHRTPCVKWKQQGIKVFDKNKQQQISKTNEFICRGFFVTRKQIRLASDKYKEEICIV